MPEESATRKFCGGGGGFATRTLVVVLTNKRADYQQCESYLGQITLDKLFNFRVTTMQRRIEKRNSGNAEGEHEKGTEEGR